MKSYIVVFLCLCVGVFSCNGGNEFFHQQLKNCEQKANQVIKHVKKHELYKKHCKGSESQIFCAVVGTGITLYIISKTFRLLKLGVLVGVGGYVGYQAYQLLPEEYKKACSFDKKKPWIKW